MSLLLPGFLSCAALLPLILLAYVWGLNHQRRYAVRMSSLSLVQRFEFHFTLKHGSWLNMAEIELSTLVRQCLDRRIPDMQLLTEERQAWQQQRNDEVVKVLWQCTTTDARTKLKHLSPKIQVRQTTRSTNRWVEQCPPFWRQNAY